MVGGSGGWKGGMNSMFNRYRRCPKVTDQNHEDRSFRMSMTAKRKVEENEEDRKVDGKLEGEDRAIGKRRKPKKEGGAFEA